MTEPESPRDANTRERLQQIARMIDEELPQRWGFVLLAFPFGDEPGRRMNYVSNAQREDAVKTIKEWITKTETSFGQHV